MAKKNNKKKNRNEDLKKIEEVGSLDTNIWHKIFTVLGIICFFCLFYLLTLYITNKNSDKSEVNDNNPSEVSISSENIIIGRSLSMGDGDYFVIYYDSSNEEVESIYSEVVSNYRSKEDALKLYYVDMSSAFNKSYATTEASNRAPEDISSFKINGPTLMKVSQGKVVEYYEGETEIKDVLA